MITPEDELKTNDTAINQSKDEGTNVSDNKTSDISDGKTSAASDTDTASADSTAASSGTNTATDKTDENPKASVQKKLKYKFEQVDVIMLPVVFVLSFLCIKYYNFNTGLETLGLGATVYIVLYVISILGYARLKCVKLKKESIILSILIILLAISFTTSYNYSLNILMQMLMNFMLIYLPVTVFSRLVKKETSAFILYDYINALIFIPIYNATSFWVCMFTKKEKTQQSKKGTYFFSIILGLLIGTPFILIVLLLLSSADATFQKIFENLFTLKISVPRNFETFIWAIPMATYLYALIYGSSAKNQLTSFDMDKFNKSMSSAATVPRLSIYTINIVICSFYILFICIQAVYFINILSRSFSIDFTYSNYARRGFFELIAIALINIFFIWATKTLAVKSDKNKYMHIHICLISSLTLILIAVAFAKMYLYIYTYGLTTLRIIPSVFMLFLCFVFAFIIIGEFKKDFNITKLSFYTGSLLFVLLSLSNIDGLVAQYNLNAYVSKRLPHYDVWDLIDNDMAAIPVIYNQWQKTTDAELKKNLSDISQRIIEWQFKDDEHSSYNYTKNKAYRLSELME